MIILHEHPFNIVQQWGFIDLCKTLQPQFKMVSRNTIKLDCLGVYKEEKSKLLKVFDSLTMRVSLTSNMRTYNQSIRYMAIIAHLIDSNWTLQKRMINFVIVDPPHMGAALADGIKSNLIK